MKLRILVGITAMAAMAFGAPQAGAVPVAVFNDSVYVGADESANVQSALTGLGHGVSTFTGITAGDFTAGVAGASTLLFPELEAGDLGAALGAPALGVITGFLASGGRIVVIGSEFSTAGMHGSSLVNAILGTAYGETALGTGSSSSITAAAAGSPFAGDPSPVSNLSGTSALTGVAAADAMYTSGGDASVAYFGSGGGLAYVGWDWFYSSGPPVGSADWDAILDDAVGGSLVAVPAPATLALLGGGLLLAPFARRRLAA